MRYTFYVENFGKSFGGKLRERIAAIVTAAILTFVPGVVFAEDAQNRGDDWSPVFQKVVASVVRIECGGQIGAGVIIDAERGYIVTARHVIVEHLAERDPAAINVRFYNVEGTFSDVQVLGSERLGDISIFQILNPPPGLTQASVGSKDSFTQLTPVIVIGQPDQLEWDSDIQYIRNITDDRSPWGPGFFGLNKEVLKGYSGGPVFLRSGELIGIISFNAQERAFARDCDNIRSLLIKIRSELNTSLAPRVTDPDTGVSIAPPRGWVTLAREEWNPSTVFAFADNTTERPRAIAKLDIHPKSADQRLSTFVMLEEATGNVLYQDYRVMLVDNLNLHEKGVSGVLHLSSRTENELAVYDVSLFIDLGESVHKIGISCPKPMFEEKRKLLEEVILSYDWPFQMQSAILYRTPVSTMESMVRFIRAGEVDGLLSCFDVDEYLKIAYEEEIQTWNDEQRAQKRAEIATEIRGSIAGLQEKVSHGVKFEYIESSETSTTAIVERQTADGVTHVEALLLKKIDGRWKIVFHYEDYDRDIGQSPRESLDEFLRLLVTTVNEDLLEHCDVESLAASSYPEFGTLEGEDRAAALRSFREELLSSKLPKLRDLVGKVRFEPAALQTDPDVAEFVGMEVQVPTPRELVRITLRRQENVWRIVEIDMAE
ncbi:MAG: trypsin-like peptidase domain-containing protein [Planctomycetes bacterium]|nr:trypsin-like peptidase domain-containing protein [Planctomycetota bacterium]